MPCLKSGQVTDKSKKEFLIVKSFAYVCKCSMTSKFVMGKYCVYVSLYEISQQSKSASQILQTSNIIFVIKILKSFFFKNHSMHIFISYSSGYWIIKLKRNSVVGLGEGGIMFIQKDIVYHETDVFGVTYNTLINAKIHFQGSYNTWLTHLLGKRGWMLKQAGS